VQDIRQPNPIRAEKDWPPAVVGGVFQTGLNLMRDLIAKGVRAVGVDSDLEHEGFRSSYGKSYACPDPDDHPREWVEFMQRLAGELGGTPERKPVFICAADLWVTALGAHEAELRSYFTFSPAAQLQAALTTKEQQYALADRHGFPRPLTAYIQSKTDLQAFIAQAQFPCLLKPLSHREWSSLPEGNFLRGKKVVTSDTAAELLSHYELCEPYRPNVVAQEIIQGPDTAKHCYFGVYASDGALLSSGVVQEFRTHPMFFGMASVLRPVVEEEISSLCERFFKAVGYVGICEVEVKRDTRDGKVKLIEVNPRFTGSGDSAVYMGVETGWLHYLDLIGQKPAPVAASRFDFHHICLKLDCMTFPKYLSEGAITWHDVIAPYHGTKEFYDFDVRDRRLAATTVVNCVRYLAGGALRGVFAHFRRRS
jgi:D-aspartate ligase